MKALLLSGELPHGRESYGMTLCAIAKFDNILARLKPACSETEGKRRCHRFVVEIRRPASNPIHACPYTQYAHIPVCRAPPREAFCHIQKTLSGDTGVLLANAWLDIWSCWKATPSWSRHGRVEAQFARALPLVHTLQLDDAPLVEFKYGDIQ